MFRAPRYLEWARRFYGQVSFDLASSGIPQVRHTDFGATEGLDDTTARERLRAAIARFNGVSETEVVVALGATHALWLAYSALINPGDEVLVEAPAYEPLHSIAEGIGARVTRFSRPVTQNFRLDVDRLAHTMTDKTRVVAITNMHNPSGRRATDDELREAASLVAKRGASLLVDEVYAPFDKLVSSDGVWGQSARRLSDNVVSASSLTKGFGLGQQRIGWVLGSASVIQRAEAVLLATCGRLPIEQANVGCRAFAHIVELASRAQRSLGPKRAEVARWVASRAGVSWSAPDSGLFGFLTCARPDDLTSRIEAAVRAGEVVVAPGAFFGVPNGFRLSWSIEHARLAEGLSWVDRFVLSP